MFPPRAPQLCPTAWLLAVASGCHSRAGRATARRGVPQRGGAVHLPPVHKMRDAKGPKFEARKSAYNNTWMVDLSTVTFKQPACTWRDGIVWCCIWLSPAPRKVSELLANALPLSVGHPCRLLHLAFLVRGALREHGSMGWGRRACGAGLVLFGRSGELRTLSTRSALCCAAHAARRTCCASVRCTMT